MDNFIFLFNTKSMLNLTINQGFIMFRYSLIILLVLIVRSTNAFWCPKNILERLVRCLFHCDHEIIVFDDIERVRCRIECAKENYCIRKPWDLFNKKMALARDYTKCIIGCEFYFQYPNHYRQDIQLCDVECRNKLHPNE